MDPGGSSGEGEQGAALPGAWVPAAAHSPCAPGPRAPTHGEGGCRPGLCKAQLPAAGCRLSPDVRVPWGWVGDGNSFPGESPVQLHLRSLSQGSGREPGAPVSSTPCVTQELAALGASSRAWRWPLPEKHLLFLVRVSGCGGGRRAHEALSYRHMFCPLSWSVLPAPLAAQEPPWGLGGLCSPRTRRPLSLAWGQRATQWSLGELVVGTVV